MLRIAVIEKEVIAKDIIFEIAKVLEHHTWTFVHFTKISAFAKADANTFFDVVFLNEMFETERVSSSFIEGYPKRIVIFCKEKVDSALLCQSKVSRILYMNRHHVREEVLRLQDNFMAVLKSHEEYLLSYNNVHVALKMQDILYIEKCEKNVIYHTVRGEFHERKTMHEVYDQFKEYDFLRIHASFLVNVRYVTKVSNEYIEITTHEKLPIARLRKQEVFDWFHEFAKH